MAKASVDLAGNTLSAKGDINIITNAYADDKRTGPSGELCVWRPHLRLLTSTLPTELSEISEWLSDLTFEEYQKELYKTCTAGTGKWFLESPEFKNWLEGGSRELWCPGNGTWLSYI
jgi:hypothetical protein